MATNENVNKVEFGGETLIDLTEDSVTPDTLVEGETAHDASGAKIVGKFCLGDHAILYDEEQSLTDEEKAQAIKNLGIVIPSSDIHVGPEPPENGETFWIDTDEEAADDTNNIGDHAILYDEEQSLTDGQKAQAIKNLGIENLSVSSLFYITVTQDEDTGEYAADKTFDEVKAAYDSGKQLVAKSLYDVDGDGAYPLYHNLTTYLYEDGYGVAVFEAISIGGNRSMIVFDSDLYCSAEVLPMGSGSDSAFFVNFESVSVDGFAATMHADQSIDSIIEASESGQIVIGKFTESPLSAIISVVDGQPMFIADALVAFGVPGTMYAFYSDGTRWDASIVPSTLYVTVTYGDTGEYVSDVPFATICEFIATYGTGSICVYNECAFSLIAFNESGFMYGGIVSGIQFTVVIRLDDTVEVTQFVIPDASMLEDNDTKNTAGTSLDNTSKLYLVGAKRTALGAMPSSQTYTKGKTYMGEDGSLYSNGKKVITVDDISHKIAYSGNGSASPRHISTLKNVEVCEFSYVSSYYDSGGTYIVGDTYKKSSNLAVNPGEKYEITVVTIGNTSVPEVVYLGEVETSIGSESFGALAQETITKVITIPEGVYYLTVQSYNGSAGTSGTPTLSIKRVLGGDSDACVITCANGNLTALVTKTGMFYGSTSTAILFKDKSVAYFENGVLHLATGQYVNASGRTYEIQVL